LCSYSLLSFVLVLVILSISLACLCGPQIHDKRRRLKHEEDDDTDTVESVLTDFHEWASTHVRDSWWDFFYDMIGTYRDCYHIVNKHAEQFTRSMRYMGVPGWWLEQIGYWGALGQKTPGREVAQVVHPINIPSVNSQQSYDDQYPNGMLHVMNAVDVPGTPDSESSFTATPYQNTASATATSYSLGTLAGVFLGGGLAGALIVYMFLSSKKQQQQSYLPIN
jgi:hypothetical protein